MRCGKNWKAAKGGVQPYITRRAPAPGNWEVVKLGRSLTGGLVRDERPSQVCVYAYVASLAPTGQPVADKVRDKQLIHVHFEDEADFENAGLCRCRGKCLSDGGEGQGQDYSGA